MQEGGEAISGFMIHEISPQFYRRKFSKYTDTELVKYIYQTGEKDIDPLKGTVHRIYVGALRKRL